MREKKRRALQHVVAYVAYVVYVGHPHVELQLRVREGTLPIEMAVETAAIVRKNLKTGPNADSIVKIGTCINHRLRLSVARLCLVERPD